MGTGKPCGLGLGTAGMYSRCFSDELSLDCASLPVRSLLIILLISTTCNHDDKDLYNRYAIIVNKDLS